MSGHSLWRGGKLLGRIEPFPDGPLVSDQPTSALILGVLRPTAAFAGTQPVFQANDPFGRGPTHRPIDTVEVSTDPLSPIEPIEIPPEPPEPSAWTEADEAEAVMQLPPLEGAVPYTETLEIRTDGGASIECWNIAIVRMVPRADMSDYEWQERWPSADGEREVWTVTAMVLPAELREQLRPQRKPSS